MPDPTFLARRRYTLLLRHPLVVLHRSVKRPQLRTPDRALLVLLASRVRTWNEALLIVNRQISLVGTSDKLTDTYRAARITLRVDNPLSGHTDLDSNVVKLMLADGKLYEGDESGPLNLPGGGHRSESKLIVRISSDATWEGAKLEISEPHKEIAEMPLDGDLPAAMFPMALTARGSAATEQVEYTIVDAALDLDLHAKRARLGEHFLEFKVRVNNTSDGGGGLPLGEDYFRLIMDDNKIAPMDAPIELVRPQSSYEATVVFAIPATLEHAELQVGDGDTATMPLDLRPSD